MLLSNSSSGTEQSCKAYVFLLQSTGAKPVKNIFTCKQVIIKYGAVTAVRVTLDKTERLWNCAMVKIFGCPMHWGVGNRGLTDSLDYFLSKYGDVQAEIINEETLAEADLKNLKNLNSVI